MAEPRKAQLLRSRGWKPWGGSGSAMRWRKRGWSLPVDEAYALEELMERESGAVTPRGLVSTAEITRIRRIIGRTDKPRQNASYGRPKEFAAKEVPHA